MPKDGWKIESLDTHIEMLEAEIELCKTYKKLIGSVGQERFDAWCRTIKDELEKEKENGN